MAAYTICVGVMKFVLECINCTTFTILLFIGMALESISNVVYLHVSLDDVFEQLSHAKLNVVELGKADDVMKYIQVLCRVCFWPIIPISTSTTSCMRNVIIINDLKAWLRL